MYNTESVRRHRVTLKKRYGLLITQQSRAPFIQSSVSVLADVFIRKREGSWVMNLCRAWACEGGRMRAPGEIGRLPGAACNLCMGIYLVGRAGCSVVYHML